MTDKNFEFAVKFTTTASWVDEIFLGNMLAEVLGSVAKSMNAFAFDVKYVKAGEGTKEN
ncbi:MAG: hypothetical protein JRN29_03000 [Nitrososphaerota archaeon]|nr:hypothetical protein [Nitrososphaerota archaeon]